MGFVPPRSVRGHRALPCDAGGFTVAVEFRNATWFNSDKHTACTLQIERDNGLVNVVVDEPEGIANREVTNSALALVRLHGRNYGTWNRKGLKASSQRFDYDYSDDELQETAGEVKQLAPQAKTTHVLFNNNYEDQGHRGAAALSTLLRW